MQSLRHQRVRELLKRQIGEVIRREIPVGEAGLITVNDVEVVRSLDTEYGLDEQAIKAAKQWRFKPGTKDGKAVAVRVSLEMTFTLK